MFSWPIHLLPPPYSFCGRCGSINNITRLPSPLPMGKSRISICRFRDLSRVQYVNTNGFWGFVSVMSLQRTVSLISWGQHGCDQSQKHLHTLFSMLEASWLFNSPERQQCSSLRSSHFSHCTLTTSLHNTGSQSCLRGCRLLTITGCILYFYTAATVLSSVQPQLHTNAQTMFQPQASIQPMQAAVQQVTSQPTQVTNTQVTAAQMAAAQATQATTTVSQSNLSLAALQTAGLSINPAIVRMPLRGFSFCTESYMPLTHVVIFLSDQRRLLGSSATVSQFPHLYSHHYQCHVQHGWHHQPDHHKCPGTGGWQSATQFVLCYVK